MQNVTICLTGTILPNTDFVSRSDVSQRLDDYKKCLRFYLESTHCRVIFAENSEFNLSEDEDFNEFLQNERFSLIRVKSHPNVAKGKGFQEFHMLDTLVNQKVLEDYFVKVTGRYLVRNIRSIIKKMDMPLHIDLHRKMRVAITGIFGCETSFYEKHFRGLFQLADDPNGRFIEHVIYDEIHLKGLKKFTQLLPENPQMEGVSGSSGQSLARNRYKMKIRSLERAVNRTLGIPKFLVEY